MKLKYWKIFLFYIIFSLSPFVSHAQVYGVELLPGGTFGSIATTGQNGDDESRSQNIYPNNPANIPIYYQPVNWAYYGWDWPAPPFVNVEEYINTNVTIGYPIGDQTGYAWGMTVVEYGNPIFFPDVNNSNTSTNIPIAPEAGRYIIATSTVGMFNPKPNNGVTWNVVYDKFETDYTFPTNYFLIINASSSAGRFYENNITLETGQVYRMSVDISRLNKSGAAPNISFLAGATNNVIYSTGAIADTSGEWVHHKVDYLVTEASGTTYIGFASNTSEFDGNAVGFDNFSLRAITPQIEVEVEANCSEVTFSLTETILDAYPQQGNYLFQWQYYNEVSGLFVEVPTESDGTTYTTSQTGTYRLIIYTAETINYPMESNVITILVNPDQDGCLIIDNVPVAVNDHFYARPGTNMVRNVLTNDLTSVSQPAEGSSIVFVNHYTINGTVYNDGDPALLFNENGERAGIVTIEPDGQITFNCFADATGNIPPFSYTIMEENGVYDTADITIELLLDYEMRTNATCTCCPIEVWITKNNSADPLDTIPGDYSIRRKDNQPITDLEISYDDSEEAIYISFYDSGSGTVYYTVQYNGEDVVSFPIDIKPEKAFWMPNPFNDTGEGIMGDWNNQSNWISPSGSGAPTWCTDVIITNGARYFPVVTGDTSQCRDIKFDYGSTVANIHKLFYRNAYVIYQPETEQWSMASAPLKYLYSADYHADPSWGDSAAIKPKIYMRYFNVEYQEEDKENPDGTTGSAVGGFSFAFSSLKELLNTGDGFILNIGESDNAVFNGTYNFPRRNADGSDITYMYHYTDNGEWITDDSAGEAYAPFTPVRGNELIDSLTWYTENINRINNPTSTFNPWGADNRFRFIYETSDAQMTDNVLSFTVATNNNGEAQTVIVGNPLMSHIDFDRFYQDNAEYIEAYYRIFDGSNYHTYLVTDNGEPVWQGTNNDIISTNDGVYNNLIPPMQSFLVDMKVGHNNVIFIPDHISTVPEFTPTDSIQDNTKRSSMKNNSYVNKDILKVRLKIGEKENTTIIACLPLASDEYKKSEDIEKLFADEESIRKIKNSLYYPVEIYTIANNTALEINALSTKGDEKITPIGIRSNESGNAVFEIEGIDNFTAYTNVYLFDMQTNESYNLRENPIVIFKKGSEYTIEGRFYIIMNNGIKTNASSSYTNDNNILVYCDKGTISLLSLSEEIKDFELFDISGRIIYSYYGLNSFSGIFTPGVGQGTYIIRIKTSSSSFESKIILY